MKTILIGTVTKLEGSLAVIGNMACVNRGNVRRVSWKVETAANVGQRLYVEGSFKHRVCRSPDLVIILA